MVLEMLQRAEGQVAPFACAGSCGFASTPSNWTAADARLLQLVDVYSLCWLQRVLYFASHILHKSSYRVAHISFAMIAATFGGKQITSLISIN